MASKLDRLRARIKNASERTKQTAMNGINAAEALGACAVTGYASGRLSDADGEFGIKGVPYALLGAGALYMAGIYTGGDSQSHLFAVANGVACAHVGRVTYEMGINAKNDAGTTGTRGVVHQLPQQHVGFDTGYDAIRSRMGVAA